MDIMETAEMVEISYIGWRWVSRLGQPSRFNQLSLKSMIFGLCRSG